VGVLSKRSVAQTLVDGIREAASGRPVVSPTLVGSLVGTLRDSRTANPLSPRERQILALVADGRTNDQIGRELGTSISTVKALLAGTFTKLGARDRASALAVCFRRGWIS